MTLSKTGTNSHDEEIGLSLIVLLPWYQSLGSGCIALAANSHDDDDMNAERELVAAVSPFSQVWDKLHSDILNHWVSLYLVFLRDSAEVTEDGAKKAKTEVTSSAATSYTQDSSYSNYNYSQAGYSSGQYYNGASSGDWSQYYSQQQYPGYQQQGYTYPGYNYGSYGY